MTDTVTFVSPPPGLAPHTEFELGAVADSASLFSLSALTDPSVRLYVVNPGDVVPDYAPVISGSQADALALEDPSDAVLFVVARVADDGVGVNLLAPVVVNSRTGAAAQLILEGQDFPVRALLP